MSQMKTKSCIAPDEDRRITYTYTTEMACAFLQKMFDGVVQAVNNEIRKHNAGKDHRDRIPEQEQVEINLISYQASQKFCPLALVMPMSVLNGDRGPKNRQEASIFNPQHTDKSAVLKKYFYDIIMPFMYDDSDRKAFFSPSWQHEVKVSSSKATALKHQCRPRIYKFNKEHQSYVMVVLDPVRLFHCMSAPADGGGPFEIFIGRTEKIRGGNYKYKVDYCPKKGGRGKKRKNNIDLVRAVAQSLNGGRN